MIDDVFLHRIIQMVYNTYDEWHCPQEAYHKYQPMVNSTLDSIKEVHIQELLKLYDKERFMNCDNLYKERVNFLNEVQEIVDTLGGN